MTTQISLGMQAEYEKNIWLNVDYITHTYIYIYIYIYIYTSHVLYVPSKHGL